MAEDLPRKVDRSATAGGKNLELTRERRRARRHRALNPVPDAAPAEADQSKVVHIVRRLEESVTAQHGRKLSWPLISALVCIALPTLIASLYYVFIAADQYVSEARFSVRSNETQAADALGMITGLPRATVVSDSYIVSDFIYSREMVEELEQRLPLRAIYSSPEADFLTRLDPESTLDELVEYWTGRVSVLFDTTKSTIEIEVRAFSAADAKRIAEEIVTTVRRLVNDLSAQARRDAVQFAAAEVARAELRVRGAREDMLAFRTEHNEFDPAQTASATLGRVAALETERSQLKSQLAAIAGYLAEDAPSVQMLQSRIAALEGEIARVQGEISSGEGEAASGAESATGDEALANVVAKYQELLLSQEFAEKSYTAALASLERARTEADRTQSYLAVYLHPSVAQEAAYPTRVLNIFIVFVLACVLWAVGALGYLAIRDHVA
jgi:capsular polysaccharide transport system permease protein